VRRYGDAVFIKRAADLYAQGWALRQIGAELDVHWSTVGQQLQTAGVTLRRGGPEAHPASTQQIVELRDQGLTWPEIAQQVDMTVSGAWSRYRRARFGVFRKAARGPGLTASSFCGLAYLSLSFCRNGPGGPPDKSHKTY
jgi:hypothetical protein